MSSLHIFQTWVKKTIDVLIEKTYTVENMQII